MSTMFRQSVLLLSLPLGGCKDERERTTQLKLRRVEKQQNATPRVSGLLAHYGKQFNHRL